MKVKGIILSLCFVVTLSAQQNNFRLKQNDFRLNKESKILTYTSLFDSNAQEKTTKITKSKKSPGLAFLYSLIVPGLGHVYANKFETGKYFIIAEAAAWLTYVVFSGYGNWLLDDASRYSETHAGVNLSDKEKDDKFFTNIANYNNVYEYNDEKLRFGEYDEVYDTEGSYSFYWDSP